jgi:uncharacterized protein YbjQ (UPF0145 family)
MKFFGGGGGGNTGDTQYEVTKEGVPVDAIKRLKRMAGEGGKPLFTSDLSISEFALLGQMKMAPLGLVMGSCIYHVGYQIPGFFQSQEMQYLSQALYEAREKSMTRMEAEAVALNADGIVGVRLDIKNSIFLENSIEVTAIGTAVKAPAGEDHRRPDNAPFTSDLSVQDFYLLYKMGYIPQELVVGNCVYHIRHQGFMQQLGNVGVNVELDNFTQGLYEARELAMTRMQAEAERHGAEGIVGVNIVEKSFSGWNPNVIEFLAVGTSVIKRKNVTETTVTTEPTLTLSLDETGGATVNM